MQFIPYSKNDAEATLAMLAAHYDYTPELSMKENDEANADFFREVFLNEGGSGIAYVLKSDDNAVLGFLDATKRYFENSKTCWYLTSLFMRADKNADENAIYMVNHFFDLLHDSNELCANVYPAATEVISFWEKNGFRANPDRSVYRNYEDEMLIAYWKKK